MRLKDVYKSENLVISYEIFPPKIEKPDDEKKLSELMKELAELKKFNPAFVSVTYGAGGSTRERTKDLGLKIKNELKLNPMPHFTCVNTNRSQILDYLHLIEKENIENILALRGDPPKGQENFIKPKDGFAHANELVEFIRANTNLSIAVAGYPEGHIEAESIEKDIENLKRKVDSGADVILTQLFFDNSYFYDFLDRVRGVGINIPVIPGIFPVTSLSQITRITEICGSKIPQDFLKKLERLQDNPKSIKEAGIEHATNQCRDLLENGSVGLHFYTLNKSSATIAILESLNLEKV